MKIKDIKLENSLWSEQLTIVSDDRQELERIYFYSRASCEARLPLPVRKKL